MKTLIKLLTFAIVLMVTEAYAIQDFQGVATYKTLTKLDIDEDQLKGSGGSGLSADMQEKIMAALKKGSQQTYTLEFDKTQSIYKKEEKLAAPQPNSGNFNIAINFSGGIGDVLYKNTKENRYTSANESYSKLFLVKDKLQEHDWKLEKETKNIGEYTCFKATKTFTRTVNVSSFTSFSTNDKNKEEKENKEPETREEEVTITAWYTPQIPVSTGPNIYHGLPGLILEINDGRTTTICSKIVLNPKNKIEIKEPKKGKKVSQAEFDKIMEKKRKEQEEQFRSRSRDGVVREVIRIGG
ncbi:GLPGLI family protein [Flavobacteriaceae bacterium AU392]|nr:GLPGLI family protein [Flavobacteriaceae bacterium]RKM81552.1 GLPGLI family protein [Flavobacteriaceae bacterium AU392]